MQFMDSHAHLTGEELYPHFSVLVEKASLAGVGQIVNICTDIPSLEKALEVMERFPSVVHTAAVPPHDVESSEAEAAFLLVKETAEKGLLKAIGETGLDYFHEGYSKELQHKYLVDHLQLANKCDLPLVIHCRAAFADFFQILDRECCENGVWRPGVLHCFTGTLEEAQEVIKRGWMISLSGIITFKKSDALRTIAKEIPLENIVIETDAPWLAPQAFRGQRNEPAHVVEVAKVLADVKGISLNEVAETTCKNTKRLFRL